MEEPIDLRALFPDRKAREPLKMQLVRRLRAAIESGFFPPASRMLPTRELAHRLDVSRNTITAAFEQLIAEGYLEARIGAGTFVAGSVSERPRRAVSASVPAIVPDKFAAAQRALAEVGSSSGPLRVGAPDLAMFPRNAWRRIERENFAGFEEHLDYAEPSGLPELREAISHHIAQFRGVVARPDQIIVVEGAQSALNLIAFAMASRGERIAIEDPCYQLARTIFAAHGLVLRGVSVDENGMRTGALPADCSLAYVTPSHQFPLGGALTLARRMQLLDWARQSGAYVVEDDYDSEFASHPLPALQALDADQRVIYVGTFSKSLAPGLRLGYLAVPPHLVQTFGFAREVTSLGSSTRLQKTVAEFIRRGHFSRHIRRMTAVYERRRRLLVGALRALPDGFRVGPALTGLHVAIAGPPAFDDVRAAGSLREGRVLPISRLCIERTDCKGLVVGFSAGSDAALEHAAAMLAGGLGISVR